jgi:hypothetical protein
VLVLSGRVLLAVLAMAAVNRSAAGQVVVLAVLAVT